VIFKETRKHWETTELFTRYWD